MHLDPLLFSHSPLSLLRDWQVVHVDPPLSLSFLSLSFLSATACLSLSLFLSMLPAPLQLAMGGLILQLAMTQPLDANFCFCLLTQLISEQMHLLNSSTREALTRVKRSEKNGIHVQGAQQQSSKTKI